MAVEAVFVRVEYRQGPAAAVVRHRGEDGIWLVSSLEFQHDSGARLDGYEPVVASTHGGRTAQAGRMPPGAVKAMIATPNGDSYPTEVGGGIYIGLYAGDFWGPQAVLFTDAQGAIVAVPRAEGTPIPDATLPCPACGGCEWTEAESEFVCRTCGHAETGGSSSGWTAVAGRDQRRREADVLRSFSSPVYAVRGRRPYLNGWATNDGQMAITVEHEPGGITVETIRHTGSVRDPHERARQALAASLEHEEPPDDLSEPAQCLWRSLQRRAAAGVVGRAQVVRRELRFGGRPATGIALVADDRWAAAADRSPILSVTVTAVGVDIDEVELVALDDPLVLLSPEPA